MSAKEKKKRIEELIACAQRELKMREKVYATSGGLTPAQKRHELACMAQIVEALEKIRDEQSGTQNTLF